jgi:uncharacterized protein YigA (DUF484 family)
MRATPVLPENLRETLLANPALVLDDAEIMRALLEAGDEGKGENVVDLRAAGMKRLETRLADLHDTHRSVIATAYDNVAGMNMIHRAVLALLPADTFAAFCAALAGPAAEALRVEVLRLVVETEGGVLPALPGLVAAEPGFVRAYMDDARRPIVLRPAPAHAEGVYGVAGIGSEALILLHPDTGHGAAMLALGSADQTTFRPGQGTDLLSFLAAVVDALLGRLAPP